MTNLIAKPMETTELYLDRGFIFLNRAQRWHAVITQYNEVYIFNEQIGGFCLKQEYFDKYFILEIVNQ